MASHQSLDGRAIVRVQLAAGLQMVSQALRVIERPRLEGGHKLALVDQTVLKREQSEKEMAVSSGCHVGAPGQDVVPGLPDFGNGAGREGMVATS
jgi:hypothetical protein